VSIDWQDREDQDGFSSKATSQRDGTSLRDLGPFSTKEELETAKAKVRDQHPPDPIKKDVTDE
jgi:hypothetical protein